MNFSRFTVLCLITIGISLSAHGSHEGRSHDEISRVTSASDLRSRAEQGDAYAQVKLGDIYNNRKKFKEAVKLYRAAADQGYADGYTSLGVMYDGGDGVPQNYERAVHYYRLAAKQGDVLSQYFFGVSYMKGEGVPMDYVRAYMWFEIAASHGLGYAIQDRELISKKMSASAIAEAKRLAQQ